MVEPSPGDAPEESSDDSACRGLRDRDRSLKRSKKRIVFPQLARSSVSNSGGNRLHWTSSPALFMSSRRRSLHPGRSVRSPGSLSSRFRDTRRSSSWVAASSKGFSKRRCRNGDARRRLSGCGRCGGAPPVQLALKVGTARRVVPSAIASEAASEEMTVAANPQPRLIGRALAAPAPIPGECGATSGGLRQVCSRNRAQR